MGQSVLHIPPVDAALSLAKSDHQGVSSAGAKKFIPQGMPHLGAAEREDVTAFVILALCHENLPPTPTDLITSITCHIMS